MANVMEVTDNTFVDSVWMTVNSDNMTLSNVIGDIYEHSWIPDYGENVYNISMDDISGNFNRTPTYSFTVLDSLNPSWDEYPKNQIVPFESDFSYDLNASDNSAIISYWINDSVNFQVNSEGIISNKVVLSPVDYPLTVRAYDVENNYCEANITVSVVDIIAPTWDAIPEDQVLEFGQELSYEVSASDGVGIDVYWIDDTVNFHIDGDGVITNILDLESKTYELEIRAYDLSGNYCSALLLITVNEPTGIEISGFPFLNVVSLAAVYLLYQKKKHNGNNSSG